MLMFQLRLTVAEAVGSMCHLMAGEKLEEQIPKLIPAILSLYKKNNEHYIISKVGTDKLFIWDNLSFQTEGHQSLSICKLSISPVYVCVLRMWVFCFSFFPLLPLRRVCAKCSMRPSAWGAGCWRRSSTVWCWRCISRYFTAHIQRI